jgi:polyhydroxyalkanoate synthesis regulator phasin
MMHMNAKNKWLVRIGTVLVAGILTTGVAMADGGLQERLQKAVEAGKLTQGQAEVMTQLHDLRVAAWSKLKADSQALIEQAVKDGKITREQADEMLERMAKPGRKGHKGWHGRPHGFLGKEGHPFKGMTPDQMKAKLDEAVKAGKLTREQADKMLERFTERFGDRTQAAQ